VQNELDSGELCYLSEVALDTEGYYQVYTAPATDRSAVVATFVDWIRSAALISSLRDIQGFLIACLLHGSRVKSLISFRTSTLPLKND
jgi:hypothetical protein